VYVGLLLELRGGRGSLCVLGLCYTALVKHKAGKFRCPDVLSFGAGEFLLLNKDCPPGQKSCGWLCYLAVAMSSCEGDLVTNGQRILAAKGS